MLYDTTYQRQYAAVVGKRQYYRLRISHLLITANYLILAEPSVPSTPNACRIHSTSTSTTTTCSIRLIVTSMGMNLSIAHMSRPTNTMTMMSVIIDMIIYLLSLYKNYTMAQIYCMYSMWIILPISAITFLLGDTILYIWSMYRNMMDYIDHIHRLL